MSSLDINTITELLKEDKQKPQRAAAKTTPHLPPIQLGPLRYTEKSYTCTSSGCRAPCNIKVDGAPYCTTHALYALNHKFLPEWVIEECDCNTGKHSMLCMHNEDCVVYERLKEQESVSSSGGTESLPGEL